jgi:hypothetical protein
MRKYLYKKSTKIIKNCIIAALETLRWPSASILPTIVQHLRSIPVSTHDAIGWHPPPRLMSLRITSTGLVFDLLESILIYLSITVSLVCIDISKLAHPQYCRSRYKLINKADHLDWIRSETWVGKYIHGQPSDSDFSSFHIGLLLSNGRLGTPPPYSSSETCSVISIIIRVDPKIRRCRGCLNQMTLAHLCEKNLLSNFGWILRPERSRLCFFLGGIVVGMRVSWVQVKIFYCEPAARWKKLKRGEHAPSIERKRLRIFSEFSYDF